MCPCGWVCIFPHTYTYADCRQAAVARCDWGALFREAVELVEMRGTERKQGALQKTDDSWWSPCANSWHQSSARKDRSLGLICFRKFKMTDNRSPRDVCGRPMFLDNTKRKKNLCFINMYFLNQYCSQLSGSSQKVPVMTVTKIPAAIAAENQLMAIE